MLRRSLAALLLAGTVALGSSSALSAQSGPGAAGTRAKRAATNAAARTDAHTNAMQSPTAAAPQPATGQARGQVAQISASPAQAGQAPSGDGASVAVKGGKDDVGFRREAFGYERSGRRDPFLSLLHSHDLRPMINDLKLVAVLYDPVGRSWAVMRDMTTNEQYRVKVGQQLGRMRVTQIHPKSVTFTIEEIGFSRQQTLALNDSKEREP
ncbi:MAG: hypothetical protein ACT4PJ_10725 [Gemmatimonadaceae bacterium]